MRALQQGCIQIGERFFQGKKRPYERFYTIEYNADLKETVVDNKEQYMQAIQQAKAGGGTNFMIVFQRIMEILEQFPNTKEVVVIFITDGEDTLYVKDNPNKYAEFSEIGLQIKTRPNLKSRFMTIGFSRDHQAAFMNEIAGYGTEVGNFIFVDSYEAGY